MNWALRSPWSRRLGVVLVLSAILSAAWVGWRIYDRDPEISAADVAVTPALIERGRYLATAADCTACHTVPGGRAFAGGLPFKLPFGTIYSTNLTADRATGIGTWSDDDFVRALHTGVAKDGSHLYPAFPYTSYTALSRDDAVSIKAYLFSLPTVQQSARPNELAFPFNQRWALALWNLAFLHQHRFQPQPRHNDLENRGRYLATALGHCGECHTPRNIGFAMRDSRFLSGETLQGWRAYNITSDRRAGIGAWSDGDIAAYLRTGHATGRGSAAGPMAEAVTNSLRFLSADDIAGLVAFLRTVPAQGGDEQVFVNPAPAAMLASSNWAPAAGDADNLGRRMFEGACASCHQWNGRGQQTPYADLRGARSVNDPSGGNLIQVVLNGADLRAINPAMTMPAFGSAYSNVEIAALSNYLISHFGGMPGRVTPNMVASARAKAR